jgi:hypothetical protein
MCATILDDAGFKATRDRGRQPRSDDPATIAPHALAWESSLAVCRDVTARPAAASASSARRRISVAPASADFRLKSRALAGKEADGWGPERARDRIGCQIALC